MKHLRFCGCTILNLFRRCYHVSNVFALDLQTKSLKDLQPRINEQINDLLFQVHHKSEDTSVDLSFTRFSNNQFNNSSGNSYGGYKRSSNEYRNSSSKYNGNWNNFYKGAPSRPKPKTCSACRSVKEPFIGHDIYNCPNIAAADRADLLKSFSLFFFFLLRVFPSRKQVTKPWFDRKIKPNPRQF